MGFPHHLLFEEKYRWRLAVYLFNNFSSHSEGEAHFGYWTRRLPLSEAWAPVNVVVIDDLSVELGDRRFELWCDNIRGVYQRMEPGLVWTTEESRNSGEDGERVGLINGGGNSAEFGS